MWVNIDACPVLQVHVEEQNISVVNLVQLEHVVGVTELSSLCSDFLKGEMPKTYANTSAKVDSSAQA
jgi:hypothetical protein